MFIPLKEKYISLLLIDKKRANFQLKDKYNYVIILFYIIGAISYLFSLNEIEGVRMTCFKRQKVACIYILVTLTFISSFFISISIYLILFKNYKKIHLIIIFVICLLFYNIDHNDSIIKHGFYNFIGFLFSSLILFIIFCFFNFIHYLFKKRYFFIIIPAFLSIISFFYILIRYKSSHFSCDYWNKGLNNTYIDNMSKDYPCDIDIPQPHSCYLSEIGPYFDFSKIYNRTNCLNPDLIRNEKRKYLKDLKNLKYIKLSKKNHFGYPLTNNNKFPYQLYGCILRPGIRNFEKDINEKVILMDLYYKNKKKYYPNEELPEIEIILNKQGGKIKFHIKRNKTLIKERRKIYEKIKNKLLYQNILVMFFDTLSRVHFHRKFSKSIKFLEQFSKYEPNPLKKKMTVFEYFKYHSLNSMTDPNIKAAYYGTKVKGKGIHFANHFKKNGYIIGRVNSICEKETVFNIKNPSSFEPALWDHEGISLGCIKTFYRSFLVRRLYNLVKKCLFGRDINEHALQYLENFWNVYKKENKLFLFQTLEGHEPTGEVIGYMDTTLFEFFNNFYNKGYFNNTAILLFSDHGQHLNGPLYLFNSQDYYIEKALPSFFLILPNDAKLYKDNLYEKIKSNQQIFITPFDIYNTLIHLAFGENKEEYKKYQVYYGGSLLSELNYKKRFCNSLIYDFQIRNCYCKEKN